MCPVLWLEEQPVPGALSLVPVGASAGSTWSWVIGSDKETGSGPGPPSSLLLSPCQCLLWGRLTKEDGRRAVACGGPVHSGLVLLHPELCVGS